ncbi:MAG TPA: DNRLRE domain-containing protein [Pyrinomonadaceae bacterium]|nr:DNRLRE domain-containing protein [Pyrinomonadaceae bacterium]
MPCVFGRKQNVNSIVRLVVILFAGLFLAGCYPQSAEKEKAVISGENWQAADKTSNNKDIFARRHTERLFGFLQTSGSSLPNKSEVDKNFGNLPLKFEPNHGQLDPRVKFSSGAKGFNFFITPSETVFLLNKTASSRESKTPEGAAAGNKKAVTEKSVVRMQFVGIDKNNKILGADEMPGKSNYFLGNDRSKWQTDVPQFAKIRQEGVYPGVDVLYYGNQNQLEYDVVVNSGSDPNKIKIKFEGAKKLSVDKDGNLVLLTGGGEIKQSKPIAYQLIGATRHIVECRYVLIGKNKIGFELGEYDKSKILTIDPIINYSTYIGGTSDDYIKDIALDAAGNVYVTGYTYSTNFPTITGSYRATSVGVSDVFAFKLNPAGTALIYSTYVGGSSNQTGNGNDYGNSIAVDASGNAFIAGTTGSTNFPVSNARQTTYGGGGSDAFVLKLNSTGSALLFSTYHGGSVEDFCNGIAVDTSGNAYLTGGTNSQNFPVLNAYQSSLNGYFDYNRNIIPSRDIFISKFNPTGSLVYSTYLGGDLSYTEWQWRMVNSEHGNGIAVDSQGSAYVTGVTNSKSFPMINEVDGPGYDRNTDAFVVKLNAAGNGLIFSTYLSGSDPYFYCCIDEHFSSDAGIDIAVDAAGSAHVVGNTESGDFPVVNAYQSINKSFDPYVLNYETSAHNSLFVTKFSPEGNSLIYSTYLGGSGLIGGRYYLTYCAENASSIAVDSSGSAYVTGNTCSWDFPLSNSVLQSHKNYGNDWDAFVTKFTPDGSALDYSTYLGGDGYDLGNSVAVDSFGNTYLAGTSASANLPFTTPAYQSVYRGGYEGFIAKIGNSSGFNITGRITKPDGSGVGGVGVRITGPLTAVTTSDVGGYYTFLNLAPDQNYIVTPLAGYYTFQPVNQSFSNLSSNVTADFTADVHQIGGRVTESGNGVAGVTVSLSGSATQSARTDANGYYLFEVLPGNYTVTPSKAADPVTYVFTPQSRSFSDVRSNQTANFTVERIITSETVAMADAYVQDGTSANVNFGAATTLKAETDSKTNNNKNFDSYLKFDLISVNRNIKSARLRIYAAASTTGSVTTSAYSVGAVNWLESGAGGITWNNKPARGATALTGASATVTGTNFATYELDVTGYIKSEKAAGRNIISLALHNPSSSTLVITANSREAAFNKPHLVITTSADDNIAPSVSMTAPANGNAFTAPASMTVSASAADSDGAVSRVDFYNGTTLIGSSTAPVSGSVYSVNWSGVPAGSYVLSAIAFDDRGAQATAAPVNITVNPANSLPTVSLVNPASNSTFAAGSNISLSATAGDADGSIGKVEFFSGTTLLGTAATPVSGNIYRVSWNNAPAGNHTLTAKATDNGNGTNTSSAVTVNIVGQTGLSPTADAYVQDGSSATTNFGAATELRTQVSAASGSNRETYLKFDLTAATGITKAVLRLYGRLSDTSAANLPVSVYPVSTTTWIETGSGSITWNTRPAAGATALSATTVTSSTPQWYELDLTSYIRTEKAAGRNIVSLVVKGNAAGNPYAVFNSREATASQPQLIMQTTQPRDVLMVVGSTTLNTGDNAVKTRLQNLGFTVTVKAAGSTTSTSIKSTDADGKALVLISSTVTPANVGTKLKNIPVPVLNWEFDLADDFGMTNTASGTDFGTASTQTQAAIVAPAHPMSAGLTGTQTLVGAASAFSWGKPNANADKIASLTTDSTRLVIYGYDAGKAMFGLDAPARRVAVYLSDTTAAGLTTSGGLLFDAAVNWASQVNISPTIIALSPDSGAAGTSVTITGKNFGATQGAGAVTFNGAAAAVTNWSDTSITAAVPGEAATGFVFVTAGGVTSNGAAFTVTNSNGDTDGDGIPDAWEMLYFGNLNYGANDDPDGDGATNLQEYLQGRNPTRGAVSNPNAVDLKVYTQLEP